MKVTVPEGSMVMQSSRLARSSRSRPRGLESKSPSLHHTEGGSEIGDLCHLYSEGASIDALARQHKVNRTTIITHLDRAGIERRRATRKMTEDSVARAATRYRQGTSLAVVAQEFGVHARTLAREFHRADVAIRPRLGWQPQP